eukprot:551807_1
MLFSFLFCCILFAHIHANSVCDEVDILFVIDDESIIANGADIIDFIAYIAEHECSEYAGFTVNVYGSQIPQDLPNILLSLKETEFVHQRRPLIQKIRGKLGGYFDQITKSTDDSNNKQIELLDAFHTLSAQPQPAREPHKRKLCGDDPNCQISLHDDTQRIFVFDHKNTLSIDRNQELFSKWSEQYELNPDNAGKYTMVDSNKEICALFKYLEDNTNKGEGLIVMEGPGFTHDGDDNKLILFCDNEIPQLLEDQQHIFIQFTPNLFNNVKMAKYIGSMTCPANVITEEGELDLGNHDQWVPSNNIISCFLQFIDDNNDVYQAPQLTSSSYIRVKDFKEIDDDMNYGEGEYLLFDPKTFSKTPSECFIPVYKIVKIENDNDGNKDDSFTILKLTVQLPLSPMEYIYDIKVKSDDVKLADYGNDDDDDRREMLSIKSSYNLLDLSFGENFEYTKTLTYSQGYNVKKGQTGRDSSESGPTVSVNGNGKITIKYGYGFETKITVSIDFYWGVFTSAIRVEVKLQGYYKFYAYFTASMESDLTVKINDLLDWGKERFFWLGPCPVIMRPFINVGIVFDAKPFKITAGIDCAYKESFAIGYHYDNLQIRNWNTYNYFNCGPSCAWACDWRPCVCLKNCGFWDTCANFRCTNSHSERVVNSYKINTRTKEINTCTKKLEIGESQDHCPAAEFGFDIKAIVKFGANFYDALTTYFKGELVMPFRITVPEMDGRNCGKSSSFDMCSLSALQASFTIRLYLNLYVGYKLDLNKLKDRVAKLIVGIGNEVGHDASGSEVKIGTYDIISTRSLGCMDLNGALSGLNTHYKGLCCNNELSSGKYKFGFKSCELKYGESGLVFTIDFFWAASHYRCTVRPTQKETNYICDSTSSATKICAATSVKYAMQISNPGDDDACIDAIFYPTNSNGGFASTNVRDEWVGNDGYHYRYYDLKGSNAVPSPVYGYKKSGFPACNTAAKKDIFGLDKFDMDIVDRNKMFAVLFMICVGFILALMYCCCYMKNKKRYGSYDKVQIVSESDVYDTEQQ